MNYYLKSPFLVAFKLSLAFSMIWATTIANGQRTVGDTYELILDASQLKGRDALPLLEDAKTFCASQPCPDSVLAKLYQRLGVAYFQAIIDDNLAAVYTDSARMFYSAYLNPDDPIIANQWYNLAVIERTIGRYDDADEHMGQALNILERSSLMERLNRDSVAAKWYQQAANIKLKLQDGATGLGLAKKALQLAKQQPNATAATASIVMLIGNEYYNLGDFGNARTYYLQAEHSYAQIGEGARINRANVLYTIGNTYSEEGQLAQAFSHYQQALPIYEALEAPSSWAKKNWANVLHNLAWNYIKAGQLEQAADHLAQELPLLRMYLPHERYPAFGNHYLLRAKLAVARNNYEAALEEVDRALTILYPAEQEADGRAGIIGPLEYVIEALDLRAEILTKGGDPEAGLQQYEQLSQLIQQQRRKLGSNLSQYALSKKIKPAYEKAIGYALQQNDAASAYQFCALNKAIVFQQSVQNSRALTEARLPKRVRKAEHELSKQIQATQSTLYKSYQKELPTDSLKSVLFDQQQAYLSFISTLEEDYPDYYQLKYQAIDLPVITDIQHHLDKKQLFIEYFIGQDNIYAFVANQNSQQVYTLPYPTGLSDSINFYRELLENGLEIDCEAQFIGVSHYLYQQLLGPILQDFPNGTFTRLVIIPDGLLSLLSFEALIERPLPQLNGAEAFLLERMAISYAFSSQMLLQAPQQTTNAPALFLGFGLEYDDPTLKYLAENGFGKAKESAEKITPCGGVDTSRYFGRLYHSDDEVATIAQLLGGRALLNTEATKKTFLADAPAHKILHLAMHGVFDLHYPLNSSLLFNYAADEDLILRAAEIYGLQLQAEMVVLSACNTAYGALSAGEGPMSLARAFHHAGTKATVASLWSVSDYATAHIMQLFYEELLNGANKDVALRNAKLAYLNHEEYSSPTTRTPFYWAPTIIIGDTTPLNNSTNRWWLWGLILLFLAALIIFASHRITRS